RDPAEQPAHVGLLLGRGDLEPIEQLGRDQEARPYPHILVRPLGHRILQPGILIVRMIRMAHLLSSGAAERTFVPHYRGPLAGPGMYASSLRAENRPCRPMRTGKGNLVACRYSQPAPSPSLCAA